MRSASGKSKVNRCDIIYPQNPIFMEHIVLQEDVHWPHVRNFITKYCKRKRAYNVEDIQFEAAEVPIRGLLLTDTATQLLHTRFLIVAQTAPDIPFRLAFAVSLS